MRLGYQPRLDGVRAVAVALVLEEHFVHRLALGGFGVDLFFVLSGYLISRIILQYAAQKTPVSQAAKQFYWRRSLRIFPPFYLTIGITALLGVAAMRQDWPWHAFFLTNIKVFLDEAFGPATTFWSLAVEEQFYLVWFFALMLVPLRHTAKLIVGGIVVGLLFRLIMYESGYGWAFVLLPGTFHFFCFGALIAYGEIFRPKMDTRFAPLVGSPAILVLLIGLRTVSGFLTGSSPVMDCVNALLDGLIPFSLVSTARNGPQGYYLEWLAFWPIRHIGQISYGLYVYHYFVPQVLDHYGWLSAIPNNAGGSLLKLIILSAITLAVAEASWHLMERPIAKLKSVRVA